MQIVFVLGVSSYRYFESMAKLSFTMFFWGTGCIMTPSLWHQYFGVHMILRCVHMILRCVHIFMRTLLYVPFQRVLYMVRQDRPMTVHSLFLPT
jgi:hypothetical protein